jgi:excisionase family DNA binding protein
MSDSAPQLSALLTQLVDQLADELARRLHAAQPQPEERSPWLGIEKAAAYLDWPKQRLYKLTAQAAIPHYKHDGRLLFNRHELDHWLTQFAQPVRALAWPPKQSY